MFFLNFLFSIVILYFFSIKFFCGIILCMIGVCEVVFEVVLVGLEVYIFLGVIWERVMFLCVVGIVRVVMEVVGLGVLFWWSEDVLEYKLVFLLFRFVVLFGLNNDGWLWLGVGGLLVCFGDICSWFGVIVFVGDINILLGGSFKCVGGMCW